MESLAVGAFKGYSGELDSRSMLLHFLAILDESGDESNP